MASTSARGSCRRCPCNLRSPPPAPRRSAIRVVRLPHGRPGCCQMQENRRQGCASDRRSGWCRRLPTSCVRRLRRRHRNRRHRIRRHRHHRPNFALVRVLAHMSSLRSRPNRTPNTSAAPSGPGSSPGSPLHIIHPPVRDRFPSACPRQAQLPGVFMRKGDGQLPWLWSRASVDQSRRIFATHELYHPRARGAPNPPSLAFASVQVVDQTDAMSGPAPVSLRARSRRKTPRNEHEIPCRWQSR